MIFLKSFLFISANFFLLYLSGLIFVKFFKIKNFSFSIFFTITIISILISFAYFKLNLQFNYIRIILITFLIISLLLSIKLINKNSAKKIFFDYLIFLPPIILFSFLIQFYGLQYYIFRGNYYDTINYTSMSLAFSNHTYSELNEIFFNQVFNEDNIYLIKAGLLNEHRVIAPLFFSIYYLPNLLDIFHANFLVKLFFLALSSLAIKIFFEELKIINNKRTYLYSSAFPLCFWPIYIFEIDAFAQLMALPFSIVSLCIIFLFSKNLNKFSKLQICFYSLIISGFFCIYPEQGITFALFGVIIFLINNYKFLNFFYFAKKIFLIFGIFVFVILLHENILTFLKFQLNEFTFIQFNWWGYYGSFILGSDNLVLNDNFVFELKNFIKNNNLNLIDIILKIHNDLKSNNYTFYFLNILPSLSGMYYLTVGKVITNLDFIKTSFVLVLNFLIIKILLKNLITIFKIKKNFEAKFIKIFLIYFFIFGLMLIFKNALWQLIKLYMYFSIIFFLLITINFSQNFEKNKTNKIIIILLLIFPIYKFTEFNHGITRSDSFPSIIDKEMKINIDWNIKKKELIDCNYSFSKSDLDNKNQSIYYLYSIIRSYGKESYSENESSCNKN